MLKRSTFLGVSGAALLAACGQNTGPGLPIPQADDGEYGSLLNAAEYDAAPQSIEIEALQGLPIASGFYASTSIPAMHTLGNLPPVSTQGSPPAPLGFPGSCEAQSFGYGLGSYTSARYADGTQRRILGSAYPENLVSAAWMYLNRLQQQYGCSFPTNAASCKLKGTLAIPYLEQLASLGAPSAAQMPYDPAPPVTSDTLLAYLYSLSTNVAYDQRFLIGSYRALPHISPSARATLLPYMKQLLAVDHAIAFSGLVPTGYSTPLLYKCVYYFGRQGLVPTLHGGHGQLIVGYDDTKGDPNDPGAFLVQNSFGPQWPGSAACGIDCTDCTDPLLQGRIWYSYSSFFASQKLAAIAYEIKNGLPTGTALMTTNSLAPAATIAASSRYTRTDGSGLLVFVNEFGAPVDLGQMTLQPPAGNAINVGYNAWISNGYTYFSAAAPFSAGIYGLTMAAQTTAAGAISYTGSITVG